MSKFVFVGIFALGLFAVSCAAVKTQDSAKLPTVDENGEPIDWAKEIAAYNADPKNEIKIICEEITPTGSHLPIMRCQTTAQRDNRRRQDQQWLERFVRGS